jgi:nitroimidazol reductase NimA-like FMN-containing flavoprotein (pyridoxamine 5'-phosphate oxidase superfamily)
MRDIDTRTGIEVMDQDECLFLLRGEVVGRLAVVHGNRPVIYPVNFVLDGEDIVFRTNDGIKVEAGLRSPVCFEVDQVNRGTHAGWSVVVAGRLEEALPDRDEAQRRLVELPLESWAGPRDHVFRVVAERITGRRVGPRSG